MRDLEQELRAALRERVDRDAPPARPLAPASRRTIRRRRLALATSAAALVAATGIGVAVALDPEPRHQTPAATPAPPRQSVGTAQDAVWDRDVRFELSTLQCATGSGNKGSSGQFTDQMVCSVWILVLNESGEDLLLPPYAHTLRAGDEEFPVWRRGMTELVFDESGTPFDSPIPPGGGALGILWFELPLQAVPDELEVHAAEGSPGAVIRLGDCTFSSSRETASGFCYGLRRGRVEPRVAYPHRISGPRGGMQLYYVCFDEREWEVVHPHPTAVSREGFIGQGVMSLQERNEAIYTDNSGVVLTLRPTEKNEEDPGVCG